MPILMLNYDNKKENAYIVEGPWKTYYNILNACTILCNKLKKL